MLKKQLQDAVRDAVAAIAQKLQVKLDRERIALTPPKRPEHGDFACNAAMMLAKPAKRSPVEVAELIKAELLQGTDLVAKADIAGPGFLNLFVDELRWREVLLSGLTRSEGFLHSDMGAGQTVNVEYVSANPTGPLHIAHGRGAVIGDIVARLLKATGHQVVREYYVNDLGNQVQIMARSIFLRYRELFGHSFERPEDFYPGDYIIELAEDIKSQDGDSYVDAPQEQWLPLFVNKGIEGMLGRIKRDLKAFGIEFDSFVSERQLAEDVGLDAMLSRLEEAGHIYESENKRWFRTSTFGDEKDRVVVRDDGRTTYFASDIAYHDDKMRRGAQRLINVWGADHGGYVARVNAGLEALGYQPSPMEVILIQMVSLKEDGQERRMGKRLGNAIWLSDVLASAGADATRFFFAMRKVEAQMDFDIALATKKSLDNPVYYAQMGHARLASIGRKAREKGIATPEPSMDALSGLKLAEELSLVKKMAQAGEMLESAARDRAPHYVVHFVQELIGEFHSYYTKYRDTERVVSDDIEKTQARLLLCKALQNLLHSLLVDILGVSAPEEMYLEDIDEGVVG